MYISHTDLVASKPKAQPAVMPPARAAMVVLGIANKQYKPFPPAPQIKTRGAPYAILATYRGKTTLTGLYNDLGMAFLDCGALIAATKRVKFTVTDHLHNENAYTLDNYLANIA